MVGSSANSYAIPAAMNFPVMCTLGADSSMRLVQYFKVQHAYFYA
jgi:hypothetical protein